MGNAETCYIFHFYLCTPDLLTLRHADGIIFRGFFLTVNLQWNYLTQGEKKRDSPGKAAGKLTCLC